MTDREKVIFGLKCLTNEDPYMSRISCKKKKCPYAETETDNCAPAIWRDALKLLKEQEPRLVVKEDFVNADRWGYLPVYVEERDGFMYWDCITDASLGDTVSRFWTAKPTDEQRKAVKWDG